LSGPANDICQHPFETVRAADEGPLPRKWTIQIFELDVKPYK